MPGWGGRTRTSSPCYGHYRQFKETKLKCMLKCEDVKDCKKKRSRERKYEFATLVLFVGTWNILFWTYNFSLGSSIVLTLTTLPAIVFIMAYIEDRKKYRRWTEK